MNDWILIIFIFAQLVINWTFLWRIRRLERKRIEIERSRFDDMLQQHLEHLNNIDASLMNISYCLSQRGR